MTSGMSVTVRDIDGPSKAVRPTGRMSARAKASRSRTICVSSFRACAMMRCMRTLPLPGLGRCGSRAPSLVLFRDGEEHVLEGVLLWNGLEYMNGVAAQAGRESASLGFRIAVDDDVEPLTEQGDAPGLHLHLQRREGALRLVGADLKNSAFLHGLDAARRAFQHDLASYHEAEAVTLFGFLEIVRGDEDGRALIGEAIDRGPE